MVVIVFANSPHSIYQFKDITQNRIILAMQLSNLQTIDIVHGLRLNMLVIITRIPVHPSLLITVAKLFCWSTLPWEVWSTTPHCVLFVTLCSTAPRSDGMGPGLGRCTYDVPDPGMKVLASFPGSHILERKHWICVGVESLVSSEPLGTPTCN